MAIIGFIIWAVGVAWTKGIFSDRSLKIGGFYVRDLPYKGYKRFRSEKWNMEHM